MNRLQRLFKRAPIALYRMRLGGLLGRRFLLLEHVGRTSGLRRRTVLEVVEIDAEGRPTIVSGYGERSDWFRNVSTDPRVAFTIARHRVPATALRLGREEAVEVFDRYRAAHPRAAEVIGRRIGVSLIDDVEGAARQLPLFRLRPDTPPRGDERPG
jgi:deazaflavin-dependent oxidoreductase (nitroreductase family)